MRTCTEGRYFVFPEAVEEEGGEREAGHDAFAMSKDGEGEEVH